MILHSWSLMALETRRPIYITQFLGLEWKLKQRVHYWTFFVPQTVSVSVQLAEQTLECMSQLDGMVVGMESSRCKIVAIEIDDPRGKGLTHGR